MKFVLAFAAVVLAVFVGRSAAGPADQTKHAPAVEANARLIGYASVLLVLPLAAEVATGIRPGLLAHALIGFLLIPPLLLKLGSVGYRFVRYYAGDPLYRQAGPPQVVMRVIGPASVALTVALFGTGIELWLFGFRYGTQWLTWHKLAFVAWFLVLTVHVSGYVWQAPQLAIADSYHRLGGTLERRSLVLASLIVGLALVIAMLPFASPFRPLPGAS